MEYMSVKETAQLWGISERYVQRYCTQGRIEGAVKFGRSWAIPRDVEKPADLRRAEMAEEKADGTALCGERMAMPLINTAFTPGHCMESIVHIDDADSRNMALAEYYYFSGQSTKASDLAESYLVAEDLALRLSACWIYAYANLALDQIPNARRAMAQLRKTLQSVDENTPMSIRALAVCISAGASILLHLPLPEDLPPMKQYVSMLPPGLRLFALYVQAHQAYLNHEYYTSLGIVETALTVAGEAYPIPSIYLHMAATMDYISLKQPQRAREHLLAAWELARPDDLIEAFGEHHGLLGGMLEAIIKREWPDDFRRIIAITYSFSAGWRKIHNPDTGHDVADNLTTTEFSIAMLAAKNWSNKEISANLGISTNTVKLHISTVLQKLGVSTRKELAKFMLK